MHVLFHELHDATRDRGTTEADDSSNIFEEDECPMVKDLKGWVDSTMEQLDRQATELADGFNDRPMGGTGY